MSRQEKREHETWCRKGESHSHQEIGMGRSWLVLLCRPPKVLYYWSSYRLHAWRSTHFRIQVHAAWRSWATLYSLADLYSARSHEFYVILYVSTSLENRMYGLERFLWDVVAQSKYYNLNSYLHHTINFPNCLSCSRLMMLLQNGRRALTSLHQSNLSLPSHVNRNVE
jgi:hypothetical protein